MIRLLLIFTFGQLISAADGFLPSEHAIYHWSNTAYLQAEEFSIPLTPDTPVMDCKTALAYAHAASSYSKQIEFESSQLSRLIQFLATAPPRVIRTYLPKVKLHQNRIEELRAQMAETLPPRLQIKDRVRKLTWKLSPHQFRLPTDGFHTAITWGQLEVLRGGTYSPFNSDDPASRPMRKRLRELLLNVVPDLEEQYFSMLDEVLTDTLTEVFHDETKGSHHQIDWQGHGPITLTETLSPSEACIENFYLLGAMLVDYAVVRQDRTNPNRILTTEDRFATGPVILQFSNFVTH